MILFSRKQKILASIAAIVFLLAAITYIRSPNIPEVSDAEFASAEPIDGTDVTISDKAYMALETEMKKKEYETFFNDLWRKIPNRTDTSKNFDISNISIEDVATIKKFVSLIEESGIVDSAIRNQLDIKEHHSLSYGDIWRLLIADFLIRNKSGDLSGAQHALDLLIRLNKSISLSKKVGIIELIIINPQQIWFLLLAEDILKDPSLRGVYALKIRTGLQKIGSMDTVYKRALLSYSQDRPESLKQWSAFRGSVFLSKFYDLDYMRKYYRKLAQLELPSTSMQDMQNFYESLPYCPIIIHEASDSYTERIKLLSRIHYRFLCPVDPFRSHFLTRFLSIFDEEYPGIMIDSLEYDVAAGDGVTIDQKKAELLWKMMQIPKKRNRPKNH